MSVHKKKDRYNIFSLNEGTDEQMVLFRAVSPMPRTGGDK